MPERINRPEYLHQLTEHKDVDLVKIVTGITCCAFISANHHKATYVVCFTPYVVSSSSYVASSLFYVASSFDLYGNHCEHENDS